MGVRTMDHSEQVSAKAIAEIRLASIHFADLYFHFCKVIVEEFGVERGRDLVSRAVATRAVERAEKLREIALQQNLPLTVETWQKICDIPRSGWIKALGKDHCPYGMVWVARFAEHPWFAEFAELYCDVNDRLVTEVFTGDTTQKITRSVLRGDNTCDRIFYPLSQEK